MQVPSLTPSTVLATHLAGLAAAFLAVVAGCAAAGAGLRALLG